VRPDNQLFLTDAELEEEHAKMLTANNPIAPKNIARFNMKERCYKFGPMVEQLVVHYGSDGWLLHKSSEEARKQNETDRAEAEAAARFQAEVDRALKEKEAGMDVELPDDSRQLRNQFNFGERAAQTFNYPLRDRGTMTEPPPTATISGVCATQQGSRQQGTAQSSWYGHAGHPATAQRLSSSLTYMPALVVGPRA
jgi:dynein intermediate chain 1